MNYGRKKLIHAINLAVMAVFHDESLHPLSSK